MAHAADPARPIALVTARAARDLDPDLPPLVAALTERGAVAEVVEWDDPEVDWSRFAVAVLRSTWDYHSRLSEFLNWLERVTQLTRLVNPQNVVRWNLDKHYLAELRRAGVATVPTAFVEPGDDADAALQKFLATYAAADRVVKPAIGAGSRDAQRYQCHEAPVMLAHVRRLQNEQRSVLLQPYLDRVDALGETGLVYLNGVFSHAFHKGPLLQRGSASTNELFATETITARIPDTDELELGGRVINALPFKPLVYGRIDLIRGADGSPCVLELELAEPSLYFAYAEGAAQRFAAVLAGL